MLSVPISSPLCLPSSQEYLLRVGFLADSPSVLSPGMTPGGLASVPTTGGRSVPSASPWPLASGSLPDELCPSLLLPSALPGRCHLCLASHLTPALTPPHPLLFTYVPMAPCPPTLILLSQLVVNAHGRKTKAM